MSGFAQTGTRQQRQPQDPLPPPGLTLLLTPHTNTALDRTIISKHSKYEKKKSYPKVNKPNPHTSQQAIKPHQAAGKEAGAVCASGASAHYTLNRFVTITAVNSKLSSKTITIKHLLHELSLKSAWCRHCRRVLTASAHSTHLTMVGSCSSLWDRSYKELSYKFWF